MMFDDLVDQKRPAQILKTLVARGNVPHAFLFSGVNGVGKRQAALSFAMTINCASDNRPCGLCRSCKKIKSATHPDIIEEKPSGKLIKIAQIRELIQVLSRKPHEAKNRVIIIHDAELINTEAGNALLKVLEEPPDNTFFILITAQKGNMLKTIVSRCQSIGFNPVSKQAIISQLTGSMDISAEKAALIAEIVDGNLSLALKMADQKEFDHAILSGARIGILNSLASLRGLSTGHLFSMARELFKNKERLSAFLKIMKTCFRDLIVVRFAPEKMINRDLAETITRVSETQPIDSLLKRIDAVHMAERAIQANANLRLTLEVMMIRMSRV